METQTNHVALPLRSHTILGVCEAIGEEFGFNPVYLRIPFAASVIYSPMMAIAAYLLLGLGVLAARLLVKDKQQVTESVARYADDGANSQVELKKAA
ncbi:PspC domain-containing protein [Sphingomonas flavescens]|jgi:phage shock protein C|uniref:PspC domain-containing protein n=1 Tax=Sphingomonas flavescens TaxID=3132797 RepID=UPI002804E468|nr:PspC domain-containing protein [Sphingomonas limnosediminicola]